MGLVGEWTMLVGKAPFVLPEWERCRLAGSSEIVDSDEGERDIGGRCRRGGAEAGS